MKTIMRNKDNSFNAYALNCGCVEHTGDFEGRYKMLYQEHGVYHVKFNRFTIEQKSNIYVESLPPITWQSSPNKVWESFKTLTAARKYYKSINLSTII